MKNDIENRIDIQQLVDTFYGKVKADNMIGQIFNDIIDDWDTHLQKMYRFWETVLLNEHTYQGNPFSVHAPLPIAKPHFDRWISLWYETVDSLFCGKIAEEAKSRGDKMAIMFLSKLEYYRNSDAKPIF